MPSSPRFRGPPRTPFWRTGQDQGPPRPLGRRAHGVVVMSHGGGPPPDAGPGPTAGSLGRVCVVRAKLRPAAPPAPRSAPALESHARRRRTHARRRRRVGAGKPSPPWDNATDPAPQILGQRRRGGAAAGGLGRRGVWNRSGAVDVACEREQRKRRAASRAPKQAARERAVAGRDPPPWRRRRLAAGRPQKCVSCFRRFVESMNGS